MRRSLTLIVAVLLATAALAGCVGGDGGDGSQAESASNGDEAGNETANATGEEPSAQTEPTGPNVAVDWFNGSAQGQAIPGLGASCLQPQACENVFSFEVPNGTTALVAEMAWNRSTSLSLDLDVPSEECDVSFGQDCPPESESGQSPVVIQLTNPADIPAGEWSIGVYAEDSPIEPTEFTIAVSVFEDDEVPSGYAKLAQG